MFPVKELLVGNVLVYFLVSAGAAFSTEKPFTGVFQGSGRQCYGKLFIRAKTLEWHTPFVICKSTPYEIVSKNFDATKPEIVFLLKGGKSCGFGAIQMYSNPEDQGYWHVLGYRSLDDFQKKSDAFLACRVEKLE